MAESYTVLARRYRSQNFDELVGQEAISQTLKNAITTGRVAHAYLFTGTRGVGKTSAARILAKAINCPNSKNGQPCGTCDICKSIARGEAMDVIEIDGASNNSVDQVRELRQSAGIRPALCPYKIYIIDEVHMLSLSAFNALLKTLEEPPSHVKFIFATTDVHKVPPTIISRCQRFDFKNIPTPRIAEHLKAVCGQEGIEADQDALHHIARLGNGSMRDALSLLDRVLSLGEKRITEKLLEELLGKPATAAIGELVAAIAAAAAADSLKKADALLRDGLGIEQVLDDLIEFLRNVMLANVCGKDTDLMDIQADLKPMMADLAAKFDAATLVHSIALCEQTLRSLKATTMGRPLFDALIVRLALSEQFSSIRDLLRLGASGNAPAAALPAQKKNDALGQPAEAVREAFSRPPPPANPPPSRRPAPPPIEHPPIIQARPAAAHTGTLKIANPIDIPAEPAAIWHAVRQHLVDSKNGSINTMLGSTAQLDACDLALGTATLLIPAHMKAYAGERIREKIEQSLAFILQRPIKLTLVPSEEAVSGRGAPATAEQRGYASAATNPSVPQAARVPPEVIDAVRNTPLVKQLIERLGGDVTLVELIEKPAEEGNG